MKIAKFFLLLVVCLSCAIPSFAGRAANHQKSRIILYKFRFLIQGANAYAPAKGQRIQLKFKTGPAQTAAAITDAQGVAAFRLTRCKEETAELIFRSDYADKQLYRVQVEISCGSEERPAKEYNFGLYSLTNGKYLVNSVGELDGPCALCKQD